MCQCHGNLCTVKQLETLENIPNSNTIMEFPEQILLRLVLSLTLSMVNGKSLCATKPGSLRRTVIQTRNYLTMMNGSAGIPHYCLVVLYYLHQGKKIRPDSVNFGQKIWFQPDSENPDPVHTPSLILPKHPQK